MKLPKEITMGEKYGPARKIIDQQKADEYFEALVVHNMQWGNSRERAVMVEKENLGYYSGYYDRETMQRVFKLFKCSHPIFGTTTPTAEEAFEAGKNLVSK